MRKRYNASPAPPSPITEMERLRRENDTLKKEVERLRNENRKMSSSPDRGWLSRIFHPEDDVVDDGFKVSRDKAFAAIDSERRHMTRIGHGPQDVATYILLMEHYLLKARDEWACSKKPPLDELDNIRKVGALTVACMEAHGAPPRVKSKSNPIPGQPDKHAPR